MAIKNFFAVLLIILLATIGCTQVQTETTEKEKAVAEETIQQVKEVIKEPIQKEEAKEQAVEQPPVVEAVQEEKVAEVPAETIAPQLPTEGLLVHLTFNDDKTTSTHFSDSSGKENHARKVNFSVSTTGLNDSKAGLFSGGSDYLEIDNTGFRADLRSFTVSTWIKVNDFGIRNIFSSLNGHRSYPLANILTEGEILLNLIITSDDTKTLSTKKNTLEPGKWHHLAIVLDSQKDNTASIFVDGELKAGRLFGQGAMNTGPNTLWIGRARAGANNFSGAMDEFRLYNRALSEEEIKTLYSSQASLAKETSINPLTPFITLYQGILDFLTSLFK